MTDREKKIAEIREALEKATQGPWKWVDVYKNNDFEKYNMGGFVNEEGKLICHFGNRIDYYPTEGEPPDYYDELLIANAPEWLRFLLDELKQTRKERNMLREELHKFQELAIKAANHHKAERDKQIEALRWYADEKNHKLDESTRQWETIYSPYEMDGGQRARDILKEIGVTA